MWQVSDVSIKNNYIFCNNSLNTIKCIGKPNFGYASIYNIGNSEASNKTSNSLSNHIMTNIVLFFNIKIDVFSSLVPIIDNMEIFVVKGQTNMKSMIYRSL